MSLISKRDRQILSTVSSLEICDRENVLLVEGVTPNDNADPTTAVVNELNRFTDINLQENEIQHCSYFGSNDFRSDIFASNHPKLKD